jgi:hypothetical protein
VGYGPARLHDAAGTKAFDAFLARLTAVQLLARLDFAQMARLAIYPVSQTPSAEEAEAWRQTVAADFDRLKTYVRNAAQKNESLLVWLS